MNSWTVSFMRAWTPRMSLASALRLRDLVVRERRGRLREGKMLMLDMKSPFRGRILLREVGSDMATFEEIVEHEVYKSVLHHVPVFRTLIDLGANIGLATLYLAQNSPGCRVLAVEPNPDTYRLLEHNLGPLSRAGRCKTLKAAVWGTHGLLSAVPGAGPDRFSMFAVREASTSAEDESKVQGCTMPELLEYGRFDSVDLVKIDIEGAEVELFKADLRWLDRVRSVAIEFHGDTREACRFDSTMNLRGFEILQHGNHTVLAVKRGWAAKPRQGS